MNNPINSAIGEQALNTRPVSDIHLDELKVLVRRQTVPSALLELDVAIVVEVVEPNDYVVARRQSRRSGHADEAGRACQDNFHGLEFRRSKLDLNLMRHKAAAGGSGAKQTVQRAHVSARRDLRLMKSRHGFSTYR